MRPIDADALRIREKMIEKGYGLAADAAEAIVNEAPTIDTGRKGENDGEIHIQES